MSLDQSLFLALNASASPPGALVSAAVVAAKYLYYLAPLHMLLIWIAGIRTLRFVALTGFFAMASALLFSGLLGLLLYVPRPDIVGLGHTLIEHRPSSAFPSNHAIVCFSWAATLAIYGRLALGAGFAALGLAVGWSRIYLGIHYPSDMLGSLVVSAAFAFVAAKLMTGRGADVLWLAESVQAWPMRWWAARRAS